MRFITKSVLLMPVNRLVMARYRVKAVQRVKAIVVLIIAIASLLFVCQASKILFKMIIAADPFRAARKLSVEM